VDSKVAVVGFGSIGLEIQSMLEPFHTQVTGFSRTGTNGSKKMSAFDALLPTFDVVILITPLTPETKHLMNADRLKLMKDGATLINVARGPVVDTDALVAELNSGRIGAGLDVTDPEPLPGDHPLWKCPNLIIAPHVGGDSDAFVPRGRQLVMEQLGRISRGEPLINIVS
jgi:phosphoglycerate dehydrogenase-like enzyme